MRKPVLITLLAAGILPSTVSAQTRAELIAQAQIEFDPERRIEMLWQAANPALSAVDSTWSAAVHQLAQTLVEQGELAMAQTWLRWAATVDASHAIDTVNLLPTVVRVAREARANVVARGDDPAISWSWEWSGTLAADNVGTVMVSTSEPTEVALEIDGEPWSGEAPVTLEPGTYRLRASADGYQSANVLHEVLPGVAGAVAFNLAPTLPAALRSAVSGALVRVAATQGGVTRCQTGLVVSDDGLVVTGFSGVQTADAVVLTFLDGGRTVTSPFSAARDPSIDLAVYRTDTTPDGLLEPLDETPDVAWTFFVGSCDGPSDVASARFDSAGDRLREPPPPGAGGGAVVDGDGRWLGIVAQDGRITPSGRVEALVERARRTVVAQTPDEPSPQVGSSGGVPWKWVGAGAGVVGIAVALLAGGDDGGRPQPEETGGIIITLPLRILGKLGGLR